MVLTVQHCTVSEKCLCILYVNMVLGVILWWANVHCKSNLTINKLSYSYSYLIYQMGMWYVFSTMCMPYLYAEHTSIHLLKY